MTSRYYHDDICDQMEQISLEESWYREAQTPAVEVPVTITAYAYDPADAFGPTAEELAEAA